MRDAGATASGAKLAGTVENAIAAFEALDAFDDDEDDDDGACAADECEEEATEEREAALSLATRCDAAVECAEA